MDYSFLTSRGSAELDPNRRTWLEWALVIFVLLGLLAVGVNAMQSWDDWNEANRAGDARVQAVSLIEKSEVERGAAVIGLLLQAVKDEAKAGTLNQERLETIQSRYHAVLGEVELALIGNDAVPIISTHKNLADIFSGENELGKLLAQPWKRSRTVISNDRASIAFLKRMQLGPGELNIVVIMPTLSKLFLNRALTSNVAVALYDGEQRLLTIYPDDKDVARGDPLKAGDLRPGPTPDTHYAAWKENGRERLAFRRNVDVPLAEAPWTVEIRYSSDAYLAAWRKSTWVNALGMAFVLALLAFGTAAMRRSRKLRKRLGSAGNAVGAVVRSLPLPVLLVDSDSGKINLSNESTKDVFGALSGEGEPAARLFSDPAQCAAVLSGQSGSEPIVLLTREGQVEFQVHCTAISKEDDSKHFSVITLVDVSSHQSQIKTLRSEADLDALTGLRNRHCFARMGAHMVERANAEAKPLAVLMIDIDFFKRINDTYGHASGDRVLVSVAQQLGATLRENDGAFRLGGEEFCVTLADAGALQAGMVAERLRVLTQCTPVVLDGGETISVTCSIGVALYRAGETSLEAVLERADIALYRAKNGGRNRVELNVDEMAPESGSQHVGNEDGQALV